MALRTILTILEKPVMNLFTVRPLGKGKYFTLILLKGVVWTFTAVHAVHTKGRLISKGLLGNFNSSKKRTKKFYPNS